MNLTEEDEKDFAELQKLESEINKTKNEEAEDDEQLEDASMEHVD